MDRGHEIYVLAQISSGPVVSIRTFYDVEMSYFVLPNARAMSHLRLLNSPSNVGNVAGELNFNFHFNNLNLNLNDPFRF